MSATISLLFLFAFFPQSAAGQVVISEFFYDAPGSDTDQEWVELFNAGQNAVDLTKWKISDSSNHVLNVPPKNDGKGSISIPSGGYAILASSAGAFSIQYPSVANVIDTTLSLPNTGGTISLIGEDGTTADVLSYTKDTGGAGDGMSLQRAGISSTSVSAGTPTPGSGTFSVQTGGDADAGTTTTTGTAQTTSASSNGSVVSSYVPPPVPQLFADGGEDRTVIVGADVVFEGRAYNRNQEFVDSVRFVWNFGDGSTAEGQSVIHRFDYPGRYVLWLDVARDKTAAADQVILTAEPARLALGVFPDGSVEIKNDSGRDLDLSNWIVANFGREFRLPEHSVILTGTSMRIPQKTLGYWSGAQTELRYPNGTIALRAGESSGPTSPPPSSYPAALPLPAPQKTISAAISPTPKEEQNTGQDEIPVSSIPSQTAAAAAGAPFSLWWLAVGGLAFVVSIALLFVRRLQKNEWNIIEETAE